MVCRPGAFGKHDSKQPFNVSVRRYAPLLHTPVGGRMLKLELGMLLARTAVSGLHAKCARPNDINPIRYPEAQDHAFPPLPAVVPFVAEARAGRPHTRTMMLLRTQHA